jgi:sigma-B regulation protein RsbU (phosphoserine phosphatase)
MGDKLNGSEYTEDDRDFLKTILNIAATAIQNSMIVEELKELNRELDSKIQRLNSLFELSKEFGLFSDTKRIQRLLILSLMGQFLVSKYAIINLDEFDIQILDSKYNPEELLKKIKSIDYLKIDSTLKSETIQQKYPELDQLGISLIVPMKIQNKLKGLILLGKRINNTDFSDSDIEFIYSVGSLAIISLENRRLLQEEIEKQKLEEEIELAKQIQQNLLPSEIPKSEVFEIAAINLPSKQVGGDYFDVIRVEKNKLITSIADVSGKGIPASLLMANLQAFIKLIIQQEFELDKATAIINDLLTQNTSDGRFITFFWGILDENEKSYNYVNAGHNPPILVRNGEIIRLSEGGIILGVMKTIIPYNKNKIYLQSGDMLVLFTDGVSEAMNTNSEEFGEDRLEDLCKKISTLSSQDALDLIKKEVESFTHGAPQSDDLTLMVIKVS